MLNPKRSLSIPIKVLALKGWISLLLIFGLSSTLNAQQVTYEAEEKTVEQILGEISESYNVFFSYSNDRLPEGYTSISASNEWLIDFLERLLRPHGLVAEQVRDNFYVIKTINETGVTVTAVIIDGFSNEPLPYALVRHQGEYKGTYTNNDGIFEYYADSPGTTNLEFSYTGYKTKVSNMAEIYVSEIDTISLEPTFSELDAVVIREYINTGIGVSEDLSKLNLYTQQLESIPGLSEQDALYSLQALPGIASINESASELNIRGSSGDQAAIYWENIPVYHPAHYFGLISAFIPSVVTKIDIHRNTIPVEYGSAASGLISMKGPQYNIGKPTFHVDGNLTHIAANTSIPFAKNKGTFLLAGRRSINDWIQTPTFDSYSNRLFDGSRLGNTLAQSIEDDFDFRSQLRFWDLNAKWIYNLSHDTDLSISGFNSRNDLDFDSADDLLNDVNNQKHRVNARGVNGTWQQYWNSKWTSKTSVSFTNYELDYEFETIQVTQSFFDDRDDDDFDPDDDERDEDEDEDEEEDPPLKYRMAESALDTTEDGGRWINNLSNLEIRSSFSRVLDKWGTLTFGVQVNYLDTDFSLVQFDRIEENLNEADNEKGYGYAFFFEQNITRYRDWKIKSSFRYNNFRYANTFSLDPQLSISYHPTSWFGIKSSAGIFTQYLRTLQRTNNTITNSTENIWVLSNGEDIPLIRNHQLTLGFLINTRGWLVDVDGYVKRIDGVSATNILSIVDEEEFFSIGKEDVIGIDILIRKRFNRYRSWLSYTYSEATSTFPEIDDFSFPSFLDRPHQFSWTHALNLGQFELSLGWSYATGLPFTEPQGIEQVQEDGEDFFELVIDGFNTRRLPDYHRLDTSIWYSFPGSRNAKWNGRIGLSLLNIYNRNNIRSQNFSIDEDEDDNVDLFSERRGLLGFTPNLSIKISF